jgi:2-polyprenyl-3-methyl-5-hydroxy-6-metoxy-1,4-benzoquinol methylase
MSIPLIHRGVANGDNAGATSQQTLGDLERGISDDSSEQRSSLMPGKLSIGLLTLLLRKPKTAFILVGLGSFALAFFLIHAANPHLPRNESFFGRFGAESQTTAISLIIGVLVVPLAVVLVLRKMFFALIAIARESAEKGRAPVLPFLADTVDQTGSELNELHSTGVVLESYRVADWVRRCFQAAGPATRYVGTDSHIPSEYEAVYTDYLKAQRQFLRKSTLKGHVRVLLVEMGRLRSDKFGSGSYQGFVEWHDKNAVQLKQLEPASNVAHLSANGQPFTDLIDTDIGFWEGKYVLLFKPLRTQGEREQTLLRISYCGEQLYEKCQAYVEWIESHATPVGEELPFYPEKLSSAWEHFCEPVERIKHTVPFLKAVTEKVPREASDVRVFDAATGIGIETTALIRGGFFVAANEIESSLREVANAYAQRHQVRIPAARFSHTDWLHLDEEHDRGAYDIVLVMGNSLCHLEGMEQLQTAIGQFARLLRPGGALVCDERNFGHIVDNWDTIRPDPWNLFRFNKREAEDRVMYYGDTVLGAPVEVTEKGRIIFSYCAVTRDEEGIITPVADGELGTLSMFPFKKGDMLAMLRKTAQFSSIDIYSDLKQTASLEESADFFSYVAWKE